MCRYWLPGRYLHISYIITIFAPLVVAVAHIKI